METSGAGKISKEKYKNTIETIRMWFTSILRMCAMKKDVNIFI